MGGMSDGERRSWLFGLCFLYLRNVQGQRAGTWLDPLTGLPDLL